MASPLLLYCMLGDILCLNPKFAGVSNSHIVLFLRLDQLYALPKLYLCV